MLIRASFRLLNNARRSNTSMRNTVIVISFSGSSSKTYTMISANIFHSQCTHIAFQQSSNLSLNSLGLPEQTFLYGCFLKTMIRASYPIALCLLIGSRALREIARIMSDIAALSLNCSYISAMPLSVHTSKSAHRTYPEVRVHAYHQRNCL